MPTPAAETLAESPRAVSYTHLDVYKRQYGHGAPLVARAAIEAGAKMLGVADIDEAIALRGDGIDAPILCWLIGAHADFGSAIEHDIEIGVSRLCLLYTSRCV